MNAMLVRRMRKLSESIPSSPALAMPVRAASLSWGISPRKGMLTAPLRSLRLCTRVSMKSIMRNTTPGTASPTSTPSSRMRLRTGETGPAGPSTLSMVRALLSAIACERAFSSRRLSRNM